MAKTMGQLKRDEGQQGQIAGADSSLGQQFGAADGAVGANVEAAEKNVMAFAFITARTA